MYDYEAMLVQLFAACTCVSHTAGTGNSESVAEYCLVAILEFMITIVCISSRLAVDKELSPSVKGLRLILQEVQVDLDKQLEISSIERLLSHRTIEGFEKPVMLYCGNTWEAKNAQQKLFTSALSVQGICFYLGALHGLSERPDLLSRIYVLPGGIETENRRMSIVEDEDRKLWPYPASETFKTASLPSPDPGTYIELSVTPTLWVAERRLFFSYNVESSKGSHRISSAAFVRGLSTSRGLVACGLGRCRAPDTIPQIIVMKGLGYYDPPHVEQEECIVRIVPREGPLWLVVLMDELSPTRQPEKIVLLEDECLSCAIKMVASKGKPGYKIIYRV